MKLTGKLKTQEESSGSRDEAKAAIEDAGMLLTCEELDQAAGGYGDYDYESDRIGNGAACPSCGSKEEHWHVFFLGLDPSGTTRIYQCQCGCVFGLNNFL